MSKKENLNVRAFEYYPQLKKIREHFRVNYSREMSESNAADIVGMERKHFSRFFLSKVGIGFKRWTNAFRIEKAIEAIHKRDKPLLDIALEVGFQDYRTFERNFKKETGQTPRSFKRAFVVELDRRRQSIGDPDGECS